MFSLVFAGVTHGQVRHEFEQATSENSEPSILAQSTGSENPIKFGYIKDAQPVSYENYGVSGYCAQLKEDLKKYYKFQDPDVIIPYTNRFERYKGITIECSSNTISEQRKKDLAPKKGMFSDPFFTTGAKLLIRNNKRSILNEATPSFKIGVIGETTTQQVVNSIYPSAKIVSIVERADAKTKLKLDPSEPGSIDAYITDEILLLSILK